MTGEDPLDVAARALRHRDRSRADVERHLRRAGVDEALNETSLATLERLGYLDDDRFARARADALARRGYGDDFIRADLERQGVAGEVAADALTTVEPERERARTSLAREGATARTLAKLQRKGFSVDALDGLVPPTEASEYP